MLGGNWNPFSVEMRDVYFLKIVLKILSTENNDDNIMLKILTIILRLK